MPVLLPGYCMRQNRARALVPTALVHWLSGPGQAHESMAFVLRVGHQKATLEL
jgi:hypothetical protein